MDLNFILQGVIYRMPTLDELIDKIKSFEQLPVDWNSYGSDPPSSNAVNLAIVGLKHIYKHFQDLWCVPACDDSVIIDIHIKEKDKYCYFEFCDDGDILFLEHLNVSKKEIDDIKCDYIKMEDIENKVIDFIK